MRFATGKHALGICDLCGMQYPYRLLVPDGYNPKLRVHPSCRDEPHPAEKPVRMDEGIALKNPRPDRDDDSPGTAVDHSGTARAGSANSLTLATNASSVASDYINGTLALTGGTGSEQLRTIQGYNGSTKVAMVGPGWQAIYSQEVLAGAPVGYWRLGEAAGTDALDSSGNGNDGTYVGGVTLGEDGALINDANTAVRYDGTTGYTRVVDAIAAFGAAFSVETWVYIDPTETAEQKPLVSNRFDGGLDYFGCHPNTEKTFWYNNTASSLDGAAGVLTRGAWHHVVYVRESSTVRKIYVDGLLDASQTGAAVSASNGTELHGGHDSIPEFTKMVQDEITVYGFALTLEQVAARFNAGRNGTPTESIPDATTIYTVTVPDTLAEAMGFTNSFGGGT